MGSCCVFREYEVEGFMAVNLAGRFGETSLPRKSA